MPIYEYRCTDCNVDFSLLRPSAERNMSAICPQCESHGMRVMLSAPFTPSMDKNARMAHETNERSRHEPQTLSQYKERHGAGCRCCSGAKKSSSSKNAKMKKAGSRPWMLSH